jgi:hypothetical protein
MIRTMTRIVFVVFVLAVCGAAPVMADSAPVPLCYPRPCGMPVK